MATSFADRRRSSTTVKEPFPELDHNFAFYSTDHSNKVTLHPNSAAIRGSPRLGHDHVQRDPSRLSWDESRPAARVNGVPPSTRHGRQKSISEAWSTIRARRGSVSENAHEIAEALKAPVSVKLVVLCIIWYMSSALTNTSSKSILNTFPKPITLSVIQFAFVSLWCIVFATAAKSFPRLKYYIPVLKHEIRYPSRYVIRTTLPLAMFQIGGHILSSTATEKIPVSLVHTIKGLSPLFTVLAYRCLFDIRYSAATYVALLPLTIGVILSCSVQFSDNFLGIICAFGGALVFVTQNIFSKKLFNDAAKAEADGPLLSAAQQKLDKLNLLCYCSGLAFIMTFPLWLFTDALPLHTPLSLATHKGSPAKKPNSLRYLCFELFLNGIFHFGQNILAFILLSMTSPVTYSVASLIKRVFVIVMAIIWFGQRTTRIQGLGILLTCFGLYLYDRASSSDKADKRAKLEQDRLDNPLLPIVSHKLAAVARDSVRSSGLEQHYSNGYAYNVDVKGNTA